MTSVLNKYSLMNYLVLPNLIHIFVGDDEEYGASFQLSPFWKTIVLFLLAVVFLKR